MILDILIFLVIFNAVWIIRLLLGFALLAKLLEKVGRNSWLFKLPAGIFFVLDIVFNYELTILFLDLPANPTETITNRLIRYKTIKQKRLASYRYSMAVFFCNILNRMARRVEPEGHC